MKELIRVRVQYASRQQCCKTHKWPLPFPLPGVTDNLVAGLCRILDVSFNRLREIKGLDQLHKLQKLFLCANKISHIENVGHLKNLTLLELGDNKIRASDSHFGTTHVSLFPPSHPERCKCQMLWDDPEDVGFLLDEATVLSVTIKGRSYILVLLALPLLKLACVPKLYNLLMTSLEGNHFGAHIGTFHAAFTVEKFLSLKPGQICMQVFLLTRAVMRRIMFRSTTDRI